jgi:hypothetical protein
MQQARATHAWRLARLMLTSLTAKGDDVLLLLAIGALLIRIIQGRSPL